MTLAELDVLRRLESLEARVMRLERAPTPLGRRDPYPVCTRCGLRLGGVGGFDCPHNDCPKGRTCLPPLPRTA